MLFLTFGEICDMVQQSLEKVTRKKCSISSREDFAETLLPPDMYILCRSASYTLDDLFTSSGEKKDAAALNAMFQNVRTQSRSTFNSFCNNERAKKRYEGIAALLLKKNHSNDQHYTYEDCPYRLHIKDAWDHILSKVSEDEKSKIKDNLQEKITKIIQAQVNVQERIQELYNNSIAECLTSLTLIAITLSYFEEQFDSTDTQMLRLMFLPHNKEAVSDLRAIDICKEKAARDASKDLDDISKYKSSIETDKQAARKCFTQCQTILSSGFLEDAAILGKANFYMYLCYLNPAYSGTGDKTARKYLEESYRYGYFEAKNLMENVGKFNLTFHAESAGSSNPGYCIAESAGSSGPGYCIVNCRNPYTGLFEKTIPHDKWSVIDFNADDKNQTSRLCPKKYLFFHDDFSKNLTDTMQLIDRIRESEDYILTTYIEIYLRCDEEAYGPLIDTAQNALKDHVLRIYLLDDHKFAAQYLLSRHPLFYPIRSFVPQNESGKAPLLNFVVIGSDKTAEWLVREAFWLMTFLPNEVSTKITILAPDAKRLYTDIIVKCPGLRKENAKVSSLFDGNIINEIEALDKDLTTCEFENAIDTLCNTSSYFYFAVSTGDDERNLSLSLRLREQLIRNAILNNLETDEGIQSAKDSLCKLPPIAFKCTSPDISELASHLFVVNMECGNQWFNNYALIPFGGLNTRYTWTELDGGTIEKYGLCVHMEYNGIDPEERILDKKAYAKKWEEAVNSYFARQYNKDSSMAVALSLPYRLFNMYRNRGRKNRLVSLSWNILDKEAYYRDELPSFIKETADFEKMSDDDSTIVRLSEWEQIRWSRYMLSRGWMPVSPAQTKVYMSSEYGKHQLYIAKLHPAICDFEHLKKVEIELGKSFRTYNIRNLKHTDWILQRAWLEPEKKKEIEEPTQEME